MNFSIIAKSKLPMDFINELNHDFTERNIDKILTGMSEERYTTFRANYLKSNEAEVEDELIKNDVKFEKIKIFQSESRMESKTEIKNNLDNIFYVYVVYNKNEKDLSNLKIYRDGKIYIQSISSMIPPIILNPQPGEMVLDIASAPGSKTTQMATMMNNEGYILANEIDKFRCEKLKYNVEKQGTSIVHIINKDGTKLFNDIQNDNNIIVKEFDRILVDAPCSGEGRFIVSNKKTYEYWSLKMQNELVHIQKKLISNAINLCKINGTILYSTCALSMEENEKVIDWAIKNYNIEIEKIKINFSIEKNTENKLNDDLTQIGKLAKSKDLELNNGMIIKGNKKGLNEKVENTIKILPNKFLEGFYVAKIKKLRIKLLIRSLELCSY